MADITLGAIVAGALGARTPLLPQESVVLDLERTRMAFEDLREQHVTVTSAMADNLNMVDEIMISIDHVQAAISDGLEPVDAPATRARDALRALNDDMMNVTDMLVSEFFSELDMFYNSDSDADADDV